MKFWKKRNKTQKMAHVTAAEVDVSLPKTDSDIRLEKNVERLQVVHEEFTRVLSEMTTDIKTRMGEKKA